MIEVANISYTWPRQTKPALVLPELKVEKNERLFVHGASGSGKSTLLSLLAGINIPQQGSVTILDQRIDTMSGLERDRFRAHHIGYIFQQFNLVPYLSVVENVTLPLRFSKRRADKVKARTGGAANENRDAYENSPAGEARRLLERIGLAEDLLHRPVTELSVGQQQRVAATRAMIGSPEVVIADEPTSALDADHRQSFIELLFAECQEAESTLIFVSHDSDLAPLFDRSFSLSPPSGNAQEVRS